MENSQGNDQKSKDGLVGALRVRLLAVVILSLVLTSFSGKHSWGYTHRDSPVNFHEYGPEAFEKAEQEGKPLFMVLSASWCNWCRVYQEKTLDTLKVSAYLNQQFINIFVDIDLRKEVGHLYLTKAAIPTSVVFTPKGRKFLSFSGVLGPEEFLAGMKDIKANMAGNRLPPDSEPSLSVRNIGSLLGEIPKEISKGNGVLPSISRRKHEEFLAVVLENFDEVQGGFGQGKKYPLGGLLKYLLDYYQQNGNEEILRVVIRTLEKISTHLYDPVEGGFFRYAERRDWSIAHTEKMLTTNAVLVRVYQMAARLIPKPERPKNGGEYEKIYRKSLLYLLGTLYDDSSGAFFSSQDGKNPKYYRLNAADRKLVNRPGIDTTVYTAANAEAIVVLWEVHRFDPSPRLKKALERSLAFLGNKLVSKKQGFYSRYDPKVGKPTGQGLLEDNSWGALAFITGFRNTGQEQLLNGFKKAIAFAKSDLFVQEVHAYRLWNISSGKILRSGEGISQKIPLAGNGIMALALARGYALTKNLKYLAEARGMISALSGLEPFQFEDDPNDEGKQFLQAFIELLSAMDILKQLG